MGLQLRLAREGQNRLMPRRLELILECDVATEFFCRGFETFSTADGFVRSHQEAMGKGWLERQGPSGRIWLCPTCSAKAAKAN